ncbi:7TM GPCR protein [Aphelenchoides avenae]|nr:7TM GPCR protein [Aphelenchus avenae]
MIDFEEAHRVQETITNTLSVLFNAYLLYLIHSHSNYGLKIYKVLLTVDATLDLALSLITLTAQPILLSGEGYFVLMCNGFFARRSVNVDSWMLVSFYFTYHINFTWIPAQFCYRYAYICIKDGTKSRRYGLWTVIVAVAWNFGVFFGIRAMFSVYTPELHEVGLRILNQSSWPVHPAEPPPIMAVSYLTDARLIAWMTLWTLTCFMSVVIVVICEWKILHHFSTTDIVNDNTRRMHKEFHRALLAMAICPLVTTTVPVMYFVATATLGFCPGPISIVMSSMCTVITVFNPMTTIAFMRCYREAAQKHFCRCRRKNNAVRTGVSTTFADLELSRRTELTNPETGE